MKPSLEEDTAFLSFYSKIRMHMNLPLKNVDSFNLRLLQERNKYTDLSYLKDFENPKIKDILKYVKKRSLFSFLRMSYFELTSI